MDDKLTIILALVAVAILIQAGVLIERTRAQVTRADDLLNGAMGRVERTSENVQATVMAPVRKVNAVFAGISAALDHLRGVDRPEGSPRHWGNGDFIG